MDTRRHLAVAFDHQLMQIHRLLRAGHSEQARHLALQLAHVASAASHPWVMHELRDLFHMRALTGHAGHRPDAHPQLQPVLPSGV